MSQHIVTAKKYLETHNIHFHAPEKIYISYLSSATEDILKEFGFIKNPLWKRGDLYEKGNKGIVINMGIGHPNLYLIMHELHALGTKYFVLIGLGGGLQNNLSSGDILNSEDHGIYSTDDPYREETQSWLEERKQENIAIVDMETNFFLKKASQLSCTAKSYLIVMDILSETGWQSTYNKERIAKNYQQLLRDLIHT